MSIINQHISFYRFDEALTLLGAWPEVNAASELFMLTPSGSNSLHLAVSRCAPLPFLQRIISVACADPHKRSICSVPNGFNRTPLHNAAFYYPSIPVAKLLIRACPLALLADDNDSRTPLKIAQQLEPLFNRSRDYASFLSLASQAVSAENHDDLAILVDGNAGTLKFLCVVPAQS
jgi:hypothetical protein